MVRSMSEMVCQFFSPTRDSPSESFIKTIPLTPFISLIFNLIFTGFKFREQTSPDERRYADIFVRHEIDLPTFATLTDEELKEIGIPTFGARKKLLLLARETKKKLGPA